MSSYPPMTKHKEVSTLSRYQKGQDLRIFRYCILSAHSPMVFLSPAPPLYSDTQCSLGDGVVGVLGTSLCFEVSSHKNKT